eukprot:CAMPEP_0119551690 /NCGR_PEP_ID=MMETSP1352-20130426/4877_1 /TAXON_ID=265584 /ORGANISM="Stauroneis constricta, Strain CCMP1120" /LENGTH=482 /DNA_ID=CAMNT_0007597791 /DNA_START=309 /DNA_END=1757 /DNA_ORIENTATION=+
MTPQDNSTAITGNSIAMSSPATLTPPAMPLKKATDRSRASADADTASLTSSLTANSGSSSTVTTPPPRTVTVNSGTVAAVGNTSGPYRCKDWCGKKHYSDFIKEGLQSQGRPADHVIMLFESPSTCNAESSFFNNSVFPVHDYPPAPTFYKTVLAPCRYTIMNGGTYPSFLQAEAPEGLMEHWERRVPGFEKPTFVKELNDDATVYAYLPLEHVRKHLNDPHVHYHLAGKAAIHLMTADAPRQLINTTDERPCIAKVTHSMGSKGIFIIRDDEDDNEFRQFLEMSGNPSFVVTDLVDICRNLSCHFFIHPDGQITWIGSSENYKDAQGEWSIDSIIELDAQEEQKTMQLPYARTVADYCLSLGFWGFCGIDVLFNHKGEGYIVDVNPRTTGTSPSLMLAKRLKDEYGYQAGIMRRSAKFSFRGSAKELMEQVEAINDEGAVRIVLLSFFEVSPNQTYLNISVHGNTLEECRVLIERFAQPNL